MFPRFNDPMAQSVRLAAGRAVLVNSSVLADDPSLCGLLALAQVFALQNGAAALDRNLDYFGLDHFSLAHAGNLQVSAGGTATFRLNPAGVHFSSRNFAIAIWAIWPEGLSFWTCS
jgi:hypothetical protein